jgi:hypothetical protein
MFENLINQVKDYPERDKCPVECEVVGDVDEQNGHIAEYHDCQNS